VITDIAVGNDLAPSLIPADMLTQFNSWLRRIDLGTEVGAPILAGVLYTLEVPNIHLFGLLAVVLWNLISFVPEYLLLVNVIKKSNLPLKPSGATKKLKELFSINFRESVANPIFWLILSYALLWLSVLSPHGVLLAGYLKDKVALPESEIGIFRGLGAIFGLISTFTFPYFVKRLGLISSSKLHLAFQGSVLILGILAFSMNFSLSIYSCIVIFFGVNHDSYLFCQTLLKSTQMRSF
jgi:iron-regulated transporter 1